MKLNVFFVGIIPMIILFGCSEGNSPSNGQNNFSNSFIEAVHKGCVSLQKTSGDSYLEDHYYNNDTLFLVIHFKANCCPSFVDSSDVSPGSIKIFMHDTLANCRCICDYSDEFKFLYSYEGETKLEFRQAGLSGEYELGFETSF